MRTLDILTLVSCLIEVVLIVIACLIPDNNPKAKEIINEKVFTILSVIFLTLPLLFLLSKAVQSLANMYPNH